MSTEEASYFFKILIDRNGKVVGVEPPEGAKVEDPVDIGSHIPEGVTKIKIIQVLSKPGHSPCCIKSGGIIWCWC